MQLKPNLASAEKLSSCNIERPETQINTDSKRNLKSSIRQIRAKSESNPINQTQLEKIKAELEILLNKPIAAKINSKPNQYK
jgi:hypothetical protein